MSFLEVFAVGWLLLLAVFSLVSVPIAARLLKEARLEQAALRLEGFQILAAREPDRPLSVRCRVDHSLAKNPGGSTWSRKSQFIVKSLGNVSSRSSDLHEPGRKPPRVLEMRLLPTFEAEGTETLLSVVIAAVTQGEWHWVRTPDRHTERPLPARPPATFHSGPVELDEWSKYVGRTDGLLRDYAFKEIDEKLGEHIPFLTSHQVSCEILGVVRPDDLAQDLKARARAVVILTAKIDQPLNAVPAKPSYEGFAAVHREEVDIGGTNLGAPREEVVAARMLSAMTGSGVSAG